MSERAMCQDIRVMVRAFTFRGFPVVDGDRFAILSGKKTPQLHGSEQWPSRLS